MAKTYQNESGYQFLAASKTRRGERGQTMLEFALMLPFMALLAVGVVEIGRTIFITVIVNNAATAGVEYGSQSASTASPTTGMVTAATNDFSQNNIAGGTITATATVGCVCDPNDGTSDPNNSCHYIDGGQAGIASCDIGNTCTSPAQVVECVQVDTTDTIDPLFHWPGLPSTYSAHGKAVMRVRPNN